MIYLVCSNYRFRWIGDKIFKKSYQRCLSSLVIFFLNAFALPVNFELFVLFISISSTASGSPYPQGEGFLSLTLQILWFYERFRWQLFCRYVFSGTSWITPTKTRYDINLVATATYRAVRHIECFSTYRKSRQRFISTISSLMKSLYHNPQFFTIRILVKINPHI